MIDSTGGVCVSFPKIGGTEETGGISQKVEAGHVGLIRDLYINLKKTHQHATAPSDSCCSDQNTASQPNPQLLWVLTERQAVWENVCDLLCRSRAELRSFGGLFKAYFAA